MFGMGLGEILLVAVIAIIFLGPDKLPGAMVDIARFFRQTKRTINETKDTLEKEIQLDEFKSQAQEYQQMLESTGDELTSIGDFDLSDDDRKEKKKENPEPAAKEMPQINTPQSTDGANA